MKCLGWGIDVLLAATRDEVSSDFEDYILLGLGWSQNVIAAHKNKKDYWSRIEGERRAFDSQPGKGWKSKIEVNSTVCTRRYKYAPSLRHCTNTVWNSMRVDQIQVREASH
jgi:hypothetical protein